MKNKNNQPGASASNSRREFLKKSAIAAAGLYIIPRHVMGGVGYTAPSDKLVIAGIGIGGKGESDIWSFHQSGKAEIAALVDVDSGKYTAKSRERYPKAKFYKDYREMLDKHGKSIDAVSVSTPDHLHAVQSLAAMQLGKHVYVQKPLSHNIYEARVLTEAAKRYKIVTQMGNQGASGDGVRQMVDWYQAGLIGDVHTVYAYTDRPIWPQGLLRPTDAAPLPPDFDYNLWQGPAEHRAYMANLHPFNWRGWWDYGTGALGDMACHIMAPPFQVLNLKYPKSAECSVSTQYTKPWNAQWAPDSAPVSSHITLMFEQANGKPDVKFHWMDGGIQPARPEELGANEYMGGGVTDSGNGVIMEGTKGKMMCGTYGMNPQLLPTSRTAQNVVPQTIARVPGGDSGHYAAWVEACIAGYGSAKANDLSSRFEVAGPLTESVLMGNLAIRSYDLRAAKADGKGFNHPGRGIKLVWDGPNMRVTNFEEANQFVRRDYKNGYTLG